MGKIKIFFILISTLFLAVSSSDVKLDSEKTFEEKLKEQNLDGYEADHSMENQMKDLIKEYIQEQEWKPEEIIDKKTFEKMFVSLIQRGALRQGNSYLLKILADKILEKHGEPIFVKNLEQYFDIQELTLTYSRLLNRNTDL